MCFERGGQIVGIAPLEATFSLDLARIIYISEKVRIVYFREKSRLSLRHA
jgi:hypothetical protein